MPLPLISCSCSAVYVAWMGLNMNTTERAFIGGDFFFVCFSTKLISLLQPSCFILTLSVLLVFSVIADTKNPLVFTCGYKKMGISVYVHSNCDYNHELCVTDHSSSSH